jgi:hypothetical protein
VSLSTPETVGKLQSALHAKAKGDPACAFYSLYDKGIRPVKPIWRRGLGGWQVGGHE